MPKIKVHRKILFYWSLQQSNYSKVVLNRSQSVDFQKEGLFTHLCKFYQNCIKLRAIWMQGGLKTTTWKILNNFQFWNDFLYLPKRFVYIWDLFYTCRRIFFKLAEGFFLNLSKDFLYLPLKRFCLWSNLLFSLMIEI